MSERPLRETLTPLPGEGDGEVRAALRTLPTEAAEACATVAAVSPFLRALMLADPARVERVLSQSLHQTVAAAIPQPGEDLPAVGRALREGRAEVALAVALADLIGGAAITAVCSALSDFADGAVACVLASVLQERDVRRGTHDAPTSGGLVWLAMGKLGAHELNYSSDIDLIVLVDLSRGLPQDDAVRVTQRVVRLLQERDEHGYVFRVDLRLRPDPGSTPVAVSTRAAVRYIQSRARAWERQAMVKARQIAGNGEAGAAYMAAIEPSVWPSSYDFTVLEDMQRTREEIALVRGAGTLTVPGHNVKLGRGGIREVEFFVQTLQRIAGGRDRRLRGRGTLEMLEALAGRRWMSAETARELSAAYRRLRRIEHRIQMVADEQTHTLPGREHLAPIAAMMRESDFEAQTAETLALVHRHFNALPEVVAATGAPVAKAFSADGAGEGDAALAAALTAWRDDPPAGLRAPRAQRLLDALQSDLARALAAAPAPLDAQAALALFFARLSGAVDALSLLERHRELVPVVVTIVSAAPRLAEELAQRPRLLDVLIDPSFFGSLPSRGEIDAQIRLALEAAEGYEMRLDALRAVGQEQALLIHVRVLAGALSGPESAAALTDLADAVTVAALSTARTEFERAHGAIPGGAVALLALGKFGGGEMTATSDLDIVMLYDCPPDVGESDGRRPLSPGHYYNRLAQRFVAALSAPTAAGALYEVDLRLRPSGRAGPLATHIRSFERYQEEGAWVWEHMALTRARVAAGDDALAARALAAVDTAMARPRDGEALRSEVAHMRRRMAAERAVGLKHMPGGQVDLEFLVQHAILALGRRVAPDMASAVPALVDAGALSPSDAETLLPTHRLYQSLSALLSLASAKGMMPSDAPAALQRLLARAADAPDMAYLLADIAERQAAVRALFTARITDPAPGMAEGAAGSGDAS